MLGADRFYRPAPPLPQVASRRRLSANWRQPFDAPVGGSRSHRLEVECLHGRRPPPRDRGYSSSRATFFARVSREALGRRARRRVYRRGAAADAPLMRDDVLALDAEAEVDRIVPSPARAGLLGIPPSRRGRGPVRRHRQLGGRSALRARLRKGQGARPLHAGAPLVGRFAHPRPHAGGEPRHRSHHRRYRARARRPGCYRRQDEAIRSVVPEYGEGWKCKLVLPSILEDERLNVTRLTVQSPQGEVTTVRLTPAAYLQIVAATNFKQRVRKMIEYYHADRLNYAVAGTPNRLEYDQGFFVKQGDGAADVKPIAHLYKTQVYAAGRASRRPGRDPPRGRRPPTRSRCRRRRRSSTSRCRTTAMDLCLYALQPRHRAAEVAPLRRAHAEQVERVFNDIDAKRRADRYLHAPPLLVEPVTEVDDRCAASRGSSPRGRAGRRAASAAGAWRARSRHRGPDEFGVYRDAARGPRPRAAVDHRPRHRPAADGQRRRARSWIVFNGEIFNYVELRDELEALGHRFRTRSDTEVIVHAYDAWGETRLRALQRPVGDRALGRAAHAARARARSARRPPALPVRARRPPATSPAR